MTKESDYGQESYSAGLIIGKLSDSEIYRAQGQAVGQASRSLGVGERTYWRGCK